ncbi:MAG: SDR family oxidoreductase [Cytophagales bacterium]|nr:SDR family oxidoreductase [Bernardetiaceae bacterium]MDW8210754.1 SDR family oxidoreductase [Cytophagales bacterium]
MTYSAIITGSSGRIGAEICRLFKQEGFFTIGLDRQTLPNTDIHLQTDLNRLCTDEHYRCQFWEELDKAIALHPLKCLVNNAAEQLLNHTDQISLQEWQTTLNVNLTAPFLLIQHCLPYLEASKGSVINVASIHHQLTKPRFVAYATSKSALVGLTKALAVDLAGRIRVNAISPAAIETPMLLAGFPNPEDYKKLHQIHPVGRIGQPEEVAQVAIFLASDKAGFINGANIQIDGGISGVLKDL